MELGIFQIVTGIYIPLGGLREHETAQSKLLVLQLELEIRDFIEAGDRGYNLKMGLESLFPEGGFIHELDVDSEGLFDTITTLPAGRNYRIRQTLERIRD